MDKIAVVQQYLHQAAQIEKGVKDGTTYLYIENLMISDNPLSEKKFTVRYKSPSRKIYEKTLVPQNTDDKEDIEALYRLWFIFKDAMRKARPGQDINIFKYFNREPFKSRVRFEEDPEQLRLNLS